MMTFPSRRFDPQAFEAPARRAVPPDSPARASRRQALRDVIRRPVSGAETAAALAATWAGGVADQFALQTPWQIWLGEQMAELMAQINHLGQVEQRLRAWTAYRAIDFWDDDQQLAAETLGLKLGRTPGKVVAQLRASVAGCDWLLARWRALARTGAPDWTDEQQLLASHLLGTPLGSRVAPDQVAAQIHDLEAQRDRAERADDLLRSLVEAGLADGATPDLAWVRRLARTLHARLQWLLTQLRSTPLVALDSAPPATAAPTETKPLSPTPPTAETKPFEPAPAHPDQPALPPRELAHERLTDENPGRGASRFADRKQRFDPVRALAELREASRSSV